MKEILVQIAHRPFELPSSAWKYYQEWNDVVFLHLEVSKEFLEKFVPNELEIDDFQGNYFLSFVFFSMVNVRPRNFPVIDFVSNFHELNIRTYVKSNEKSGVYFLNIEGEKWLSCFLAKTLSGLNYKKSFMQRKEGEYVSKNWKDESNAYIKYLVGESVMKKNELDRWLTERYCMFNVIKGKKYCYDIHHIEWPIYAMGIHEISIDYPQIDIQIKNQENMLMHYSPGVKVVAWDKEWLKR